MTPDEAAQAVGAGAETRENVVRSLYREMVLLRRAEETVGRLFNEGQIFGTVHLGIGQEAVPAGVCSLLQASDVVTCTYRGHGWALAKGMPLEAFFAELMARETGVCRGRGGSMHLCDARVGHLGASGIVGGGLPLAVGAAYAAQLSGSGAVAVASFGDGATNIGTFHESVNLAAVWSLPVVFVCENNLYGEFTPARDTCRLSDLARRADAYGIPGVIVDGNDAEAVRDVAMSAIRDARAGMGPTLIEAKTYRHRGHSRSDPATYRPTDELESWLLRDPLELARARLKELNSDVATLEDETEAEVRERIDAAVAVALSAPEPLVEQLVDGAYAAASPGFQ